MQVVVNPATAGIIGLGLIGGSLGAALRGQGVHVTGFDSEERHVRLAVGRGLVDVATPDAMAVAADVDVLLLAVPVSAVLELLPIVDAAAPAETVIMDVAGAKRVVVDAMDGQAGAARMVGGHPVAGKEASGPGAADRALFHRRPFVVTPGPRSSEETVQRAIALTELIGSRPLLMSAEEHDRALACTSHLPQMVSTVLAILADSCRSEVAGTGLRDTTRLARSDSWLWRDVLLANRDNVERELRRCARRLDEAADLLRDEDGEALVEMMDLGRSGAERVARSVGQ